MTGILLIDKPSSMTSHDVVARLRRSSGERGIGHAGTLDPRATGLLVLVIGGATRLAAFLTSHDKTYDAVIRLGVVTDTDDADGRPIGTPSATLADEPTVQEALDAFRGTFAQVPPAHSAKRVQGTKAYELARRQQPVALPAVSVTVRRLDLIAYHEGRLDVRVTATAGFYVRALARELGERLGCGGHLEALRRTASGGFHVAGALPLAEAERLGPAVRERLISPADALSELPAVELTETGLRRAAHGNWLSPEHLMPGPGGLPAGPEKVRLMGAGGRLVAVAESRRGVLHPVVVLG
jgi:tRNA pseudouridine55 synthase